MAAEAERSVLHVLPHPGGGGEAYVDLLDEMEDYRFTKVYLAPSPRPTPVELASGVANALRRGREHDLVHAHGEPAAGLCLPLLASRSSLVTLNGLSLARRLRGLRRRVAALNLRAFVRAADRTICVSRAEHEYLGRIGGPASSRRATVIHNGVRVRPPGAQAERLETRRMLGLADAEPVGIWVGLLDENKDPLAAIRAARAAALPLLVVGDGPLRRLVQREASASTHVLGQRRDVPRLLDAADVFVFTSHREGFSFALLEAMAHGLVPVVSDLPENCEAIGDAGIATRAGDDSLTAALMRLVEDPYARARIGEDARRRVSKLFSADQMRRLTRVVYDDILARREHVSLGSTRL